MPVFPRDGENNGNSKLTWANVREIRATYVRGQISQSTLARRFDVPQTTISQIILNRKWKEV
jgi:DNA-binding XRE family transcriptional regulator